MAEEQEKKKGEQEEEESPPESPPSKAARVEPSSSPDAGAVTTAVASPLLLGLGLGLGGEESTKAENSTKAGGFTFMQMQEYHHQALIFKHMVAGVPVPVHLILPIWKSVAASYGPHHYPSFVGLGSLCYDFRNSMEPEPGRCRRTDGKKWRCSRDVVPDQKYCDRHMHRGRNRSRKPVEGAVATTAVVPATATASSTAADLSNSNSSSSRIGSSPISVLSSSSAAAACKTGAS